MRRAVILTVSLLLTGCAVADFLEGEPDEITIAYDPAAETPADADARAHEHCVSYGKSAVYVDETLDGDGRLRRRHYHCR